MNAFKVVLYSAAVLTSFSCSVLLFFGYARRRVRLLMWSSICFAGLTVNNIVLFLDLVVFPATDLRLIRLTAALIGMVFLLYGFIWEADETRKSP